LESLAAAEQIRRIIDVMSALAAGQSTRATPVRVCDGVWSAARRLRESTAAAGHTLKLDLDPAHWVLAGEGEVDQITTNLCANAHEAMRDAQLSGEIWVRTHIGAPGFVDIHTHYDGQATWDSEMAPSSWHGVTTVVMGNCGVGFAPAAPDRHQWLIGLMEGVEDIPGTALAEGMTWDWETFPEYLDAVDATPKAINFSVYLPAIPLLIWAMGRGFTRTMLRSRRSSAR
jgi:hypothetical protein